MFNSGSSSLNVFSGGIGKRSEAIRAQVLDGLEFVPAQNGVVLAQEERLLARHCPSALVQSCGKAGITQKELLPLTLRIGLISISFDFLIDREHDPDFEGDARKNIAPLTDF